MSSEKRKKAKKSAKKTKGKKTSAGRGPKWRRAPKPAGWKAAELEYDSLQVQFMMPFFGALPSAGEVIEWLKGIVEMCPMFYPAVLDLAVRQIAKGGGERAEQRLAKGFDLMLEMARPRELDEQVDALVENLARAWRYDLARRCCEVLVGRFPDKAAFHDDLAHAAARMGDFEAAHEHASRAAAMEPKNPFFKSNQGWFHLMAGNLDQGREALERALELKPGDKIVLGNLQVHAYLAGRRGGTFYDYLLRPADREELDRLANEEDFEKLDVLSGSCNNDRLEAMAWTLFLEKERGRPGPTDMTRTLSAFFGFVHRVNQDAYMLDEDIDFVHENFKELMHKLIVKFGDVDREMIERICASLLEYYGFLTGRGLVRRADLARFRKRVSGMKGKLIDRMERYNNIRHDEALDEEEKEAERMKIFQGDHFWPHI